MRKRWGFACAMLGMAMMIFACVLCAVDWIGTDPALYHELQMNEDILDSAGVSEEELIRLDGALADCLKGDVDALDVDATVFGQVQPAFNERELTHMEDCRGLFALLRQVRDILSIVGPALFLLGAALMWNRKRLRLAAWLGPLVILIPLGAFAAWAAMDFNAAFNFFHKVLFTNDLWLLDPATDLLIRLCPAGMFMSMGVRIGILSLLAMFALPMLIAIFTQPREEKV